MQLFSQYYFRIHMLYQKVCVYTKLFYAIIPNLLSYLLSFCYPYILLHFQCFYTHQKQKDCFNPSIGLPQLQLHYRTM